MVRNKRHRANINSPQEFSIEIPDKDADAIHSGKLRRSI